MKERLISYVWRMYLVAFLGTKRDKQLSVVPKRVTNKRWMPFTYTVYKYLVPTGISLQSCNQEEDKPQPIALMWTVFNVPMLGSLQCLRHKYRRYDGGPFLRVGFCSGHMLHRKGPKS